jgi:hypothetical protein
LDKKERKEVYSKDDVQLIPNAKRTGIVCDIIVLKVWPVIMVLE